MRMTTGFEGVRQIKQSLKPRQVVSAWRERRAEAAKNAVVDFPEAEDDAMRGFLRFVPAPLRIYLAMSFWTLLAWPMAFAHLYDNFGWSPNAGNLTGLTFGGFFEGVMILSSVDGRAIWQAERQYRDFCLVVLWVNVGVVFFHAILQHWR